MPSGPAPRQLRGWPEDAARRCRLRRRSDNAVRRPTPRAARTTRSAAPTPRAVRTSAVRQADSEGGQNNSAVRRADSEGGQTDNAVRRGRLRGWSEQQRGPPRPTPRAVRTTRSAGRLRGWPETRCALATPRAVRTRRSWPTPKVARTARAGRRECRARCALTTASARTRSQLDGGWPEARSQSPTARCPKRARSWLRSTLQVTG